MKDGQVAEGWFQVAFFGLLFRFFELNLANKNGGKMSACADHVVLVNVQPALSCPEIRNKRGERCEAKTSKNKQKIQQQVRGSLRTGQAFIYSFAPAFIRVTATPNAMCLLEANYDTLCRLNTASSKNNVLTKGNELVVISLWCPGVPSQVHICAFVTANQWHALLLGMCASVLRCFGVFWAINSVYAASSIVSTLFVPAQLSWRCYCPCMFLGLLGRVFFFPYVLFVDTCWHYGGVITSVVVVRLGQSI